MRGTTCAIVLMLLSGVNAAAQSNESFTLDNGIRVFVIEGHPTGLCSAALVCPLPRDAGERELADAALLRYLIWGGGVAGGVAIEGRQLRDIALRFGGTVDATKTPDALVIYYALPTKLLKNIFQYLTIQLTSQQFEDDALLTAKRRVFADYQAGRTASVLNQLTREIETRIWPDLHYKLRSYGSNTALNAATVDTVRKTSAGIFAPDSLTLIVAGDVNGAQVKRALTDTLAGIPPPGKKAPDTAGEKPEVPALSKKMLLPAQLSRHFALVAYRLPPSSDLDIGGLLLLAEYIRNSEELKEVVDHLQSGGQAASVEVNLDLRYKAGIFYFYVAWDSDATDEDVQSRLDRIVSKLGRGNFDSGILKEARKALLISYWSSRQDAQSHALWRATMAARGVRGDRLAVQLRSLDEDDLAALVKNLLKPENRLALFTVPK